MHKKQNNPNLSQKPQYTFSNAANEIIIKHFGSQSQLLVNIQNLRPYHLPQSQQHHSFSSTKKPRNRSKRSSSMKATAANSHHHIPTTTQDSNPQKNHIPPFHIHIRVVAYALSQYDVQCRTGKFAWLVNSSSGSSPGSSSSNPPHNSSASSSGKILRMGYEVLGQVVACGHAVEHLSEGDLVVGFMGMLLEGAASVAHHSSAPNSGAVGSTRRPARSADSHSNRLVNGSHSASQSYQHDAFYNPSFVYSQEGIIAVYEPELVAPSWQFLRVPQELNSLLHENQLVGAILPGIRAYMAFTESCGTLRAGESVLITNAAFPENQIAIQVAARRGARVYCVVSSEEQWNLVQDLGVKIERVIDERREKLREVIMEETGALGLDWILDCAPKSDHSASSRSSGAGSGTGGNGSSGKRLHIDEIVPMMAPHSKIVTTNADAQYSMAICRQLLLKNITLSFLCEQTYVLAHTQQGKLLHMLKQVMEDLKNRHIRVNLHGIFTPEKIREAHRQLEDEKTYGRIIVRYAA